MNTEQSSEGLLKELLQKEDSNADKKLLMRLDQAGKIAWVEFLEVKKAKKGVDQKKINSEISSARGALNRVCNVINPVSSSTSLDTNSLVDVFSISADFLFSLDKKELTSPYRSWLLFYPPCYRNCRINFTLSRHLKFIKKSHTSLHFHRFVAAPYIKGVSLD